MCVCVHARTRAYTHVHLSLIGEEQELREGFEIHKIKRGLEFSLSFFFFFFGSLSLMLKKLGLRGCSEMFFKKYWL